MNPFFWDAFWANLGFSALTIGIYLVAALGIWRWRRWQKHRAVDKALEYTAPEIRAVRRVELEIEYGLRPGVVGVGVPVKAPQPSHQPTFINCPHCRATIMISVSLLRGGGPLPGETLDVPPSTQQCMEES